MKWANKGRTDYCAWRDIGLTMLVTAIIAIAIVLLIALFVLCLAPRNATAGDITNFRTARRLAPATIHSDIPTTRESVPVVTMYCTVTAYSPTVAETDGNPLRTASGKRVYVGGVAADLRKFPFGTILLIPGYNNGKPCTVTDSGGAIRGNKLDVFLWSTHEAVHFGRRHNVKVQVLYIPRAK